MRLLRVATDAKSRRNTNDPQKTKHDEHPRIAFCSGCRTVDDGMFTNSRTGAERSQHATGETPAPPPPSGFLGNDYSLLTPPAEGSDQKAMLRYVNPSANWGGYNKIMIAPVTFWAADDSKVSAADQQALCDYAYNIFVKWIWKEFCHRRIQPGPGVFEAICRL